jgi:lactate permease
LIANTAPVAYGARLPIVVLAAVTGLDLQALKRDGQAAAAFFSLLVPFWLIWAFVGLTDVEIWPAIWARAIVRSAIPVSKNLHGRNTSI